MSGRQFVVTSTFKINAPEFGSYDWNVYARMAFEDDIATIEEVEAPSGARFVIEAMARDYMQRGHGCTAATYVYVEGPVDVIEI